MALGFSIIGLSPHGALYLQPGSLAAPVSEQIQVAFAKGSAQGLMHLGLFELGATLTRDLAYWRDFASFYFSIFCARVPSRKMGGSLNRKTVTRPE